MNVSSMYPNIIITFNMAPNTLIGKLFVNESPNDLIKKINSLKVDEIENVDEEDDEDEDSAASNKEVFASVGMIFIPVLICCMLISLFSKPKENSKEDASAPSKAGEQVQVDNTVEEESIGVTDVIKDGSAFLEEQKAKTKDILQDMKDEILKGFDIDWSDLLVDH